MNTNNQFDYVILVYSYKDPVTKKHKEVWQEFSLPLEIHKVEQWSGLSDLWFHEVFVELKNDFEMQKVYKIGNEKLKSSELQPSKCYLTCGFSPLTIGDIGTGLRKKQKTEPPKPKYQIKPEQVKLFTTITGIKKENTAIFYLELGNGNIEVAFKHFISSERLENTSLSSKSKDLNTQFLYAAKNGELERMKALLTLPSVSINVSDGKKRTALHFSAANGHVDVIEYLLNNGAQNIIDEVEKDRNTALHYACMYNHPQVVKVLIEAGANVNLQDTKGSTPLHIACQNSRYECVRELMKSEDLLMNVKNNKGKTPLLLSLSEHKIVKLLLARNDVDIHLVDIKGNSPLIIAAGEGNYDTVVTLVEKGANVNAVNANKYSPLIMAIGKGHLRIAKYLIEHGADVNHKDDEGSSVLHFAMDSKNLEIVQLLIDKGADVKLFDPYKNCTPIQYVCIKGLHEFIAPLVKAGADVNESCEDRASDVFCSYTALLNAARLGHTDCVRELLKIENLDKNVRTKLFQQTAVHIAVEFGHFDIMKLLVDAGCNLDYRDILGRTPAHIAKAKGRDNFYEYLKKKGANVSLKDVIGISARNLNPKALKNVVVNKPDLFDIRPLDPSQTNGIRFQAKWNNRDVILRMYKLNSSLEAQQTFKDVLKLQKIPILHDTPTHDPFVRPKGVCFYHGHAYIITDHVEAMPMGTFLNKYLRNIELLPRLQLAQKVSLLMAIMHSQNVLHRNLKINNILTTENYKIALSDFGIACSLSKIDKKKDRFVAPEIKSGASNYTKQADVYSFGVCLYEMSFSKEWDPNTLVFKVPSDAPRSLVHLIMDCISDNPDSRPNFIEITKRLSQIGFDVIADDMELKLKKIVESQKQTAMEATTVKKTLYTTEQNAVAKHIRKWIYTDNQVIIIHQKGKMNFALIHKKLKESITKNGIRLTTNALDDMIKFLSAEKPDDKLITKDTYSTLLTLIKALPEKDVFPCIDLLRLLVLSKKVISELLTKEEELLPTVLEYLKSWTSLSAGTKLMLLRLLCNLLNDEDGIHYLSNQETLYKSVIDAVCAGIVETNVGLLACAASLVSNLCLKITKYGMLEKKLLYAILKVLKGDPDKMQKEVVSRLLLSLYRIIINAPEFIPDIKKSNIDFSKFESKSDKGMITSIIGFLELNN